MKRSSIILASALISQSALAYSPTTSILNQPQQQTQENEGDGDYKTSLGLIVNHETNEVYCKFTRNDSPESFPSFTQASSGQMELEDKYANIPNCDSAQLELSESLARQSINTETKVAVLPGIIAVGLCAVSFIDGAATAVTIGTDSSSSSKILETIGSATVVSHYAMSSAKDAVLGATLRAVVKVSFLCSGIGLVAGGAIRGIVYLRNR